MVDSTTVMTTIKQMGTCHSWENNCLAKQIWEWCISCNVWLTVEHILGKENTEAHKESPLAGKDTQWPLQSSFFKAATDKLGVTPGIDLIIQRLYCQLKPYIACKPDLEAPAINVSRRDCIFYAFPPFSVTSRVLQKISQEEATGLLTGLFKLSGLI